MGILVHKFGRNPAITTATDPEDIHLGGGLMVWNTTAKTVTVSAGGDAADTTDGLGAQQLVIEGLDDDFNPVMCRLELAGASAAVTTQTFRRVFRAYVSRTGAYHVANTGAIAAVWTGGTDVCFDIAAGAGQSETGSYTIPAGKTGLLHWIRVEIDSGKTATLTMEICPKADDVAAPFSGAKRTQKRFLLSQDKTWSPPKPITLDEKTDIWFSVADVSATTAAYVEFLLEII